MVRINSIYFGSAAQPLIFGQPVVEMVCEGSNLTPLDTVALPTISTVETLWQSIRSGQKKMAQWVVVQGGELLLAPDCINGIMQTLNRPLYLCTNGTLPDHFAALDAAPGYVEFGLDFDHLDLQLDFLLRLARSVPVGFRLDVSTQPSLQVVQRAFERINIVCPTFDVILSAKPSHLSPSSWRDAQQSLNRYIQLLGDCSQRIWGVVG